MMEGLLYCKDLYDPIDLKGKNLKRQGLKGGKKLNRKVVGAIRQYVDISVLHHVANETDVNNLSTKFENLYQTKFAQSKAFLIKILVNLKLKGDVLLVST